MKFLADMGISTKTVAHLREMGHDSVHLRDEQLQRADDAAVLQKAFSEGRVLLTHDLDFGDLMAAGKGRLPSVIVLRLRDMRPHQVNHYLDKVISDHGSHLEQGAIVSVTEKRIRVRRLPIR